MRSDWMFLAALAVASVSGGALSSCSQGTARAAPTEPAAKRGPATTLSAATAELLTGTWKWSHVSEDSGVRRVELEIWTLAPAASSAAGNAELPAGAVALAGRYTRTVDFLSMDGMPFQCSQDLAYRLRATYTVAGMVRDDAFELAEIGYETARSPCERGERNLGRYRGTFVDGGARVRLSWDEGEQTLARIGPAEGDAGASAGSQEAGAMPEPTGIGGAWRWHGRSHADGEVRVEVEDWQLEEDAHGQVGGTVTRTVTVFDESGRHQPCSGDTFFTYRDVYTVRGERRGGGVVHLGEVGVEPDHHPCLPYRERHLDSARGVRLGDYLELTWRGNRRQVLHRPR